MTYKEIGAQPLVIIGAGRSGTNMLRDVLTRLQGVGTWPCDEINYIWRHGNRDYETDEFGAEQATPGISSFIRAQFKLIVTEQGLLPYPEDERFIIEKTCANSLRVPFVDAVLPEAKYIFLVRDGRDVIASARKRWQAPLNIPYLLSKAKYVPKSDLYYYASRYLLNRLSKTASTYKALAVWGPKFAGMKEMSAQESLDYVCASQWVRCVESSQSAFEKMDKSKVISIRYEEFVRNPVDVLASIAQFIGFRHDSADLELACSEVRTESVGKGQADSLEQALLDVMLPTLTRHGYT